MVGAEKPEKSGTDATTERPIFNTSVTVEYVEKKLIESLKTTSKFGPNVEVTRLGVGQGFLSVVVRIVPDWTPRNPNLPESVVVKIPTIHGSEDSLADKRLVDNPEMAAVLKEKLRSFEAFLKKVHNAEIDFYNLVQKHKISLKIPRVYYSDKFSDECKQGILLIEDAGKNSFVAAPYQRVTVSEVKEVLRELAILHGFTMKHPEFQKENFVTLTEVMKEMNQQDLYFQVLERLKELDQDRLGPLQQEIKTHMNELLDAEFIGKLNDQYGIPPVLVHGDLWSFNVLWTEEEGKKKLKTVIDWQIVHSGCISEDVMRYLAVSLDGKDCREYLEELLQYYFSELEKSYGTSLPFTYDKLKQCMLRTYSFMGAIMLTAFGMFAPIQIVDKFPDKKEEYMSYVKEKATALAEDVLYYWKLFKKEH